MDAEFFKILGGVAGLAGLCVGLLLFTLRPVIVKTHFENISPNDVYRVVRMAIIAAWSTAIVGILTWAGLQAYTTQPHTSLNTPPAVDEDLGTAVSTQRRAALMTVYGDLTKLLAEAKKEESNMQWQNAAKRADSKAALQRHVDIYRAIDQNLSLLRVKYGDIPQVQRYLAEFQPRVKEVKLQEQELLASARTLPD